MNRCVFLAVLQLGLVLAPAAWAAAGDLPSDAKEEFDHFRREAARVVEDAKAKIAAKQADLVQRLLALQTRYTKEGKLDEAVAIRDRVRQLEGVIAAEKDCIRGISRPAVEHRLARKAEVEWGGTWWPAEVLEARGNHYYIHYIGWSNSWDEWVSAYRIRPCGPFGTHPRR